MHDDLVFIDEGAVLDRQRGRGGDADIDRRGGRVVTVQRGGSTAQRRVVQIAQQVADREGTVARDGQQRAVIELLRIDVEGVVRRGARDRGRAGAGGDVDQVVGRVARAEQQGRVTGQTTGVQIGDQAGDVEVCRPHQHQFVDVQQVPSVDGDGVADLVALDRDRVIGRARGQERAHRHGRSHQRHRDAVVKGVVHQDVALDIGIGHDALDVDHATVFATRDLHRVGVVGVATGVNANDVAQRIVLRFGHGLDRTVGLDDQHRGREVGAQAAVQADQRVAARGLDGVHTAHFTAQGAAGDLDHIQARAAVDRFVAHRQFDGAALVAGLEHVKVLVLDCVDVVARSTREDTGAEIKGHRTARFAAGIERVARERIALDEADIVRVRRLCVGIEHHIGWQGGGIEVTAVGRDREGRRRAVEVGQGAGKARSGRHAVHSGIELDQDVFVLLVARPQTPTVDDQVSARGRALGNHHHHHVGFHVAQRRIRHIEGQVNTQLIDVQGGGVVQIGRQGDIVADDRELHAIGLGRQLDHIAFGEVDAIDPVKTVVQHIGLALRAVDDAVGTSAQDDRVGTRPRVNGVVARASNDGVSTVTGDDTVVAIACVDVVIGTVGGREHRVMAFACEDGVVATAHIQPVVAATSGDIVVAAQGHHRVVAIAHIDEVIPRARHNAVVAAAGEDGVLARSAGDGVLTTQIIDLVVAIARRNGVVANARVDDVVAITRIDRVVAAAGVDGVAAFATDDRVVAIARHDHIGLSATHQGVVAIGRRDVETAVQFGRTVPEQRVAAAQGRAIHREGGIGGHQIVDRHHIGGGVAQLNGVDTGDVVEFVPNVRTVAVGIGQHIVVQTTQDGVTHREIGTHDDAVIAGVQVDIVVARACDEGVVARIHLDRVVTAARIGHQIVANACIDRVAAASGVDLVVAATGHNGVAVGTTVNRVVGPDTTAVGGDVEEAVVLEAAIPVQGVDRVLQHERNRQGGPRSDQAVLRHHIGGGGVQRDDLNALDIVQFGAIGRRGIGVVQQIRA